MKKRTRNTEKSIVTKSSISTTVVSNTPKRLRLRVTTKNHKPEQIQRLHSALENNPNINYVRSNVQNGTITIGHNGNLGSQDNIIATLKNLGVLFQDLTQGDTQAASQVANRLSDLNKRIQRATKGSLDLKILFPFGLAALSIRQLLLKGLQFETIPWYVLAWYAFDSFVKLHSDDEKQTQVAENQPRLVKLVSSM